MPPFHRRSSNKAHRFARIAPRLAAGALGTCLLFGPMAKAEPPHERVRHDASSIARGDSATHVDLGSMTRRGSMYLAQLEGGGEAQLTIKPHLQEALERVFTTFDVPYAAATVIGVQDGRILALVGRSREDASLGPAELALRPWAPSASVFKIITAASLIEHAGVSADSRVCYHGGVSSVLDSNLLDLPTLDRTCGTLAFGLAKSQNAIFAKLAIRHLDGETLGRTATAFGFGEALPFAADLQPSEVGIPETPLEFARASAGFWHSSLSVTHGALVAASIANDGVMPMPRLIEKAVGPTGATIDLPRPPQRRVVSPATAREVAQMMVLTTRTGTARTAFHDRRGRPLLPVEVAGKTGSLAFRGQEGDPSLPASIAPSGYLGYSWFVGFAPAEKPRLAFAVLVGNRAIWRIKAPYVAKILIAADLAQHGDTRVARVLAMR